jgi:transketolase
MTSHRDTLITQIYENALNDKSIYFLSVDFGAPSLDQFRKNLPNQFIHVGISEQNAIDLSAGLALAGNKVFVYGMAPFISMRCLEQIKMSLCQMELPVTILSVGVGLGYADSGPTHYATEDLGALRSLVGLQIYDISSNLMAQTAGKILCEYPLTNPVFIRMDRESLPENHCSFNEIDWNRGFKYVSEVKSSSLVIASGKSLSIAVQALSHSNFLFDIIDLFQRKPFPSKFIDLIKNYKKIIFIDEQTDGSTSFGYFLQETHRLSKNIFNTIDIQNISLGEKYFYENGGRDYLHLKNNFTKDEILKRIV